MGGHHGRVCISRDVDPQLTQGVRVRATSDDRSGLNAGALKTHRSTCVEEEGDGHGKAKQRNRKLSRRFPSRSRKHSEKGGSKRNEPQEGMHMMKRSEDEETAPNSMRDKLAAMLVKKSKGNFGNTKSLDKVTKQSSGSNVGDERRVKPSKRFPNEKSKQSTSPATVIRTEDSMESDCFKSPHMESIVEEEQSRLFSNKRISKPSCVIQ